MSNFNDYPEYPAERPILFSTEMVRAILDGKKTQTRRALKRQPLDILPMKKTRFVFDKEGAKGATVNDGWVTLETRNPNHGGIIRCRYGIVGDRLWVRETYRLTGEGDVIYKASDLSRIFHPGWSKYKPSIYMPRNLSRILLAIVNVRVERLQDITDADARAEGISYWHQTLVGGRLENEWCKYSKMVARQRKKKIAVATDVGAYAMLWDRINPKFPWSSNPWVWVIEFKVVDNG